MKKSSKTYVVFQGRECGIYDNWEACNKQVHGYSRALYKSYPSLELAKKAYEDYQKNNRPTPRSFPKKGICVDGACSGNPGTIEYRVTRLDGSLIFESEKIPDGTNNIAEFLALVKGLKMSTKIPVYSDSQVARTWVENKFCNTNDRNQLSSELLKEIEQAEKWLKQHPEHIKGRVAIWKTSEWGEIPADFGRKQNSAHKKLTLDNQKINDKELNNQQKIFDYNNNNYNNYNNDDYDDYDDDDDDYYDYNNVENLLMENKNYLNKDTLSDTNYSPDETICANI